MRLFIAVETGKEACEELIRVQQKLKGLDSKMSFPKSFHLTIEFLGEVLPNKVEGISTTLERIEFNEFSMKLHDIGGFPTLNDPWVIWVGIKPEEKMNELASKVVEAMRKQGLVPDKKFLSHITVARVKEIGDKKQMKEMIQTIKIKPVKIDVTEFVLFESVLLPSGPEYRVVKSFMMI